MCSLYTREINLNPYFLYIQHPSLNLKSILFVLTCPFILTSSSQLTMSLNYSLTFDFNSIVKQKRYIGPLIGIEHESKVLRHGGNR